MTNVEEILWNYIDGNCDPEQQKAISSLIARDEVYRIKYQELLKLNGEFSAMELDEPPMAFTYNVMEAVRAEEAKKPLIATINKRIILGITAFFVVTILSLLVYIFAIISWPAGEISTRMNTGLQMPDLKNLLNRPVIEGFLFFDLVLALFLFDNYLHKKTHPKHV